MRNPTPTIVYTPEADQAQGTGVTYGVDTSPCAG